MTIVELIFKKSLDAVNDHLQAHRDFLQTLYDQGLLLCSGPKDPRDGGIIIAFADATSLRKALADDPFIVHDIADYRYISFAPVKHHQLLSPLLDSNNSTL